MLNQNYNAMKKLMLITIAITALSFSGVSQRKAGANDLMLGYAQDDKVKIKKEELPEAARQTLDGDAFKGWTMVNSYRLKNGDYEVELKKGDTTQTLKFDKGGKVK